MIATRLIVHLSVAHIRVSFFITRTSLSPRFPQPYLIMTASKTKLPCSTATSRRWMDVLCPSSSPIPWDRLAIKHSLCLFLISKRYGKQTPPRERRARVCFQVQYLLHLPLKKLWFSISELSKQTCRRDFACKSKNTSMQIPFWNHWNVALAGLQMAMKASSQHLSKRRNIRIPEL